MRRKLVRVRERSQITLPGEITEALSLQPGDYLEFFSNAQGGVGIRRAEIAVAGTREAAEAEKRAIEDVAQGRYRTFDTVEEFQEHLKQRQAPSLEPISVSAAVATAGARRGATTGWPTDVPTASVNLDELQRTLNEAFEKVRRQVAALTSKDELHSR